MACCDCSTERATSDSYEVPITTRENVDALPTVEGCIAAQACSAGWSRNGPACDSGSNTLFVPAVDWCGVFSEAPKDPPIMQGMHYYGGAVASDPREKSQGLVDRVRCFHAQGALEIHISHAPRRRGHRNLGRSSLHRRPWQRLSRFGCQDRRRALPLQHRRQHRRRRDQLCAQWQAICRYDVRNRIGVLRRIGTAGMVVFAAGSGAAPVAMEPIDPDQAPIAAVDRFSDKAARLAGCARRRTIFRSRSSRWISTPDPSSRKAYRPPPASRCAITISMWKAPHRRRSMCCIARASDKPVAGQLDIIDTLPGENGLQRLPPGVESVGAEGLRSRIRLPTRDTCVSAGYQMQQTDTLRNMPVVPDKSKASMRLNGESAELHRAWYGGKVAKFFSFDEAPLSAAGDKVPAVANLRDLQCQSQPAKRRAGLRLPHRAELSADATTSRSRCPAMLDTLPLWLVSGLRQRRFPSVRDRATALKAKVLAPGVATVNCPIVFIAP